MRGALEKGFYFKVRPGEGTHRVTEGDNLLTLPVAIKLVFNEGLQVERVADADIGEENLVLFDEFEGVEFGPFCNDCQLAQLLGHVLGLEDVRLSRKWCTD